MSQTLSEIYTEVLSGKTIKSVTHRYYGAMEIEFTDETAYVLDPSGEPPTIFVAKRREVGPIARVRRVE